MKTLKKTKVFDLLETLGTKGVLTRKDILFAMNEFSDKTEKLTPSYLSQYIYGTGYYCTSSEKEPRKLTKVGRGVFKIVVDKITTPPALSPEQLQIQHLQRRLNILCAKHLKDPRNTYYGTRPFSVAYVMGTVNSGVCYCGKIHAQYWNHDNSQGQGGLVTIIEDFFITITGPGPKDIEFPDHKIFGERTLSN